MHETFAPLLHGKVPLDHLGHNLLLAALPEPTLQRWLPHLELIEMPSGLVLHEPYRPITHVHFPTTAIVSLLCVLESGASTQIAVIGREGVAGLTLLMGAGVTPRRTVVQNAGHGFRMNAQALRGEFDQGGPASNLLLRYIAALITQMGQTSVCNRHHSLDEQLCRWLLLCLDRLEGNEMHLTQELIANMLGVRRAGVNESALKLQRDGLIRYARGHIAVLDRPSLEARSCECYRVVSTEYARLLPEHSDASVTERSPALVLRS